MIDPESPEVRLAVFGRQVELFMESDIGQYLEQRAEEDIDAAVRKLKDVSPESPVLIRELQNKIKVAETIITWLAEAIRSGSQAKEAIEERE